MPVKIQFSTQYATKNQRLYGVDRLLRTCILNKLPGELNTFEKTYKSEVNLNVRKSKTLFYSLNLLKENIDINHDQNKDLRASSFEKSPQIVNRQTTPRLEFFPPSIACIYK